MSGLVDVGSIVVVRWRSVDPARVDALRAAARGALPVLALDGPDAIYAGAGPDPLTGALDLAAAMAAIDAHGHHYAIGLAAGPARLRGEGPARVLDGPAVWRASWLSTLAGGGEVWATGDVSASPPPGVGVFRAPPVAEARFGEPAFIVRDYRA